MNPRIITSTDKKLIGIHMTMSFANYKVAQLWQQFLPRLNDITGRVNNDRISLAQYQPDHFSEFNPTKLFDRWAAVEVASFDNVPPALETITVPGGLYAVFDYKGMSTDNTVFQYIYGTWLPSSGFAVDKRPHFEVLGEKYKNNDPTSEEEIWIPLTRK